MNRTRKLAAARTIVVSHHRVCSGKEYVVVWKRKNYVRSFHGRCSVWGYRKMAFKSTTVVVCFLLIIDLESGVEI